MVMLYTKKQVKRLSQEEVPVAIQPIFDSGVKEYAVYIDGYPELIIAKFHNAFIARQFCEVMKLKVAYDGAF